MKPPVLGFQDRHKGATMLVCGLGPSLDELTELPEIPTIAIGVNDIWSRLHTEYVALLDNPKAFTPQRATTIETSTPWSFFCAGGVMKDWQRRGRLRAPMCPTGMHRLNTRYPLSDKTPLDIYGSPLTSVSFAVGLAMWMGATSIGVIGCDLKDHPKLKTCVDAANVLFSMQRVICERHGRKLVNLSSSTALKALPYMPVREFVV